MPSNKKHYWPAQSHKSAGSLRAEQGLYDKWLSPIIGVQALTSITPGMGCVHIMFYLCVALYAAANAKLISTIL
jgi:hypothetical protein